VPGSNAQLIKAHHAAKARFDKATIRTQFTPNATWWVPASGAQRGIAGRPIEGLT
jgi:ketosteroid isomerase-like protein